MQSDMEQANVEHPSEYSKNVVDGAKGRILLKYILLYFTHISVVIIKIRY